MIRFIENALIAGFNRALDRRGQSSAPEPQSPLDLTPIGCTLPFLAAPHNGALSPFTAENVALSAEMRRRHVYILGATGTGKTNLLLRLIESDIAAGRSLCVVDLRGDLINRVLSRLTTAAPPQHWANHLLFLDLSDNSHAVGFNPLAGEGDIYNRALHALAVIKTQSESWGVQLEETLRNSLLALVASGWTLLEIEPLLSNAAFRTQVMASVQDSRVRSFFERFNQLSPAQRTRWTLAVLNKVSALISLPTLRRVLGQRRALPLRELLDGTPGQVMLVSLAVDRLHESARLAGGLFVSTFQSAIMARADRPESARIPVNLYVDEFETMASERFESIVAEGRRFGLGLTLSHQNNNQLDTGLRHVLRNNVHTQFYFQTGALDASELAREIGGGETREDVRTTLISQGVGQSFLIRRGQPSVRVQVLPCPDPRVERAQIEAIKSAAQSRFARPVAEIDRELEVREAQWSGVGRSSISIPQNTPASMPSLPLKPTESPSSDEELASETVGSESPNSNPSTSNQPPPDQPRAPSPTYEIRHEKLEHFRSRFAEDEEED